MSGIQKGCPHALIRFQKAISKKIAYGEDGRRTHQDMMPSGFSMQARNQGGCATEC
jgi:hypothetical protein